MVRITVLCLAFAATYMAISAKDTHSFSDLHTPVDAVYFSVVTLTTTGFGDVYAAKDLARAMVVLEIALAWTLIVIVVFHYAATVSFFDQTAKGTRNRMRHGGRGRPMRRFRGHGHYWRK
jgi:hypothetical protein